MNGPTELFRVVVTRNPRRPRNTGMFTARFPGKDFFWPSCDRIYRSRSAARERALLFRAYGATAHIERVRSLDWQEVPA